MKLWTKITQWFKGKKKKEPEQEQKTSAKFLSKNRNRRIVFLLILLTVASGILAYFFRSKFNFWILSTFLPIAYGFASLRIVGPDQIAALIHLGKPICNLKSGPVFTIWPIESVTKFSSVSIQFQIPGEPDQIFEGDDNTALPPGKVRAVRILHIGEEDRELPPEKKVETTDPYQKRMSSHVISTISFQIEDPMEFIKNIGTIDNAKQQMADMVVRVLQEELTAMTVREAIKLKGKVSDKIKEKLTELIQDWGTKLRDAYIGAIITATALGKALAEVPEAEVRANIVETNAKATKRKTVIEGEGTAEARRQLLLAEADGINYALRAKADGLDEIAKRLDMKDGKELILQVEAMRESLSKAGNVNITAGTLAEFMTTLQGITQAMKTPEKKGENNA